MAAWSKDSMPGMGVWGHKVQVGIGKSFFDRRLKIETEGVWLGRWSRGNERVRIGDQFQWNTQIRYMFDWFDIGIENYMYWKQSNVTDRNGPPGFSGSRPIHPDEGPGDFNMRNGCFEWYVGPSMNFAIEPLKMWAGIGVFFPVYQEPFYSVKRYGDQTTRFLPGGGGRFENARFEFKIGKTW
jgi:hypothetical protein